MHKNVKPDGTTLGGLTIIVPPRPRFWTAIRWPSAARRSALSASYIASILGSIVAAIIFFAFLPILRPLIDEFAGPEFFMMAMLGLIMAGFGLIISMVGFAPNP